MKSPIVALVAVCFLLSNASLSAQVLNNKRVIVTFKPLTSTAYEDSLRRSLSGGHVLEAGHLCLTDTHLWQLPDTADVLSVIGKIVDGGRTHVVDTDQPNLEMPSHDAALPHPAPLLPPSVGIFDSVPTLTAYPNSIYYNNLLHPTCAAGTQRTIIAVIDAGIDPTHAASPMFSRHLYEPSFDNGCCFRVSTCGYDFVNNKTFPTDSTGHGTFVASEIVQLLELWGDNSTKLMILKVMGGNGKGTTWNVLRALDKAACSGANIVNMSIAGSRLKQPDSLNSFKWFMNYYATNYKMLFIVGAGNLGKDFSSNPTLEVFPASFNLPSMICVAADSSISSLAAFSNYDTQGGAVHLAAPGVKVYGATLNGKFTTASGTSVATPIVSAIAAFYASRRASEFDGALVRNAIQKSLWTLDMNRPAYPKTAWHGLAWIYCRVSVNLMPSSSGSAAGRTSKIVESKELVIAPSVFNESLDVHFAADTEGSAALRVTDATGQTVFTKNWVCQKGDNTFTWLPDATLPRGLYIIVLTKNDALFYQKAIKY